jgi:uncharacterized protein YaeQ
MAHPSTLYRFQINLSDVDLGVYKTLDLRMAMHPSESHAYLLTRLIAYALNDREFLEFSPEGLSDPDAPALHVTTPHGEILLWIEIGNPSARKLHKASKAARQVKVYTYKDPEPLLKEIRENKVYHAESIEIFSLDAKFLEKLAGRIERKNVWGIIHQEGELNVSVGDIAEVSELRKHEVGGV